MNSYHLLDVAPSAARQLTAPRLLGLTLALTGPLLYSLVVAPRLLKPLVDPVTYGLIGLLVMWLLTGSVVTIALAWERKPLPWLGVRRLSWGMALLGVGLGVVCSLAVPALAHLARLAFPARPGQTVADIATQLPAWLILCGVITAACTEEVLYRAYVIQQLRELTGSAWVGATVSLFVFVAQHLATWNISHVLGVVLPLGLALTGLYLWRRNLAFVILIHLVIDLPLFLIAAGIMPQIS